MNEPNQTFEPSSMRRLTTERDDWKVRCEERQKLLADAHLVIAELRKQLDAALKPFRGEPFTHSQSAD